MADMDAGHHNPTLSRPKLERTRTWPAPTPNSVNNAAATTPAALDVSLQAAPVQTNRNSGIFEDDLNRHPEQHFLSPVQMYEYDDWAEDDSEDDDDDDDDDDDEVEWDAGITDFALFDSDRRTAQQLGRAIPSKWDDLLSSQASALDRAVRRTRQPTDNADLLRTPSDDSIPSLTPDGSPRMPDDLAPDSRRSRAASSPVVPSYLTTLVVPPPSKPLPSVREADDEDLDDEDDLPLSFYVQRNNAARLKFPSPPPRPQRPGLRYNRTMSGKLHAWRRPHWDIYPVREDVVAETRAELAMVRSHSEGDPRARRR